MTTIGTSYFPSLAKAARYYRDYEPDGMAAAKRKIEEGSIHIGVPPHKPGDTLKLIDNGTRYAIVEVQS